MEMNCITQFLRMKPPKFEGTNDYQLIYDWLLQMDEIFKYSNVMEEQQVSLATYQLTGIAQIWWAQERQALSQENTTWGDFKALLLRKFLPEVEQKRLMGVFLHLQQGSLTVTEYEKEFTKLSMFTPELVDTEERRRQRFQDGLHVGIQQLVAAHNVATYAATVELALKVEYICNKNVMTYEKKEGKRAQKDVEQGSVIAMPARKKKREKCSYCNILGHTSDVCRKQLAELDVVQALHRTDPECATCGRRGHLVAECRASHVTCHKCGKKGHYKNKCPKLNTLEVQSLPTLAAPPTEKKQQSAINQDEASTLTQLIAGNFMVNNQCAYILFSTAVSHSFVSKRFVNKHHWETELLAIPFKAKSPVGVIMKTDSVVRRCEILLKKCYVKADLIALDMNDEFDVILGMDWLREHKAVLDFGAMRLIISIADVGTIIINSQQKKTPPFLSALVKVE